MLCANKNVRSTSADVTYIERLPANACSHRRSPSEFVLLICIFYNRHTFSHLTVVMDLLVVPLIYFLSMKARCARSGSDRFFVHVPHLACRIEHFFACRRQGDYMCVQYGGPRDACKANEKEERKHRTIAASQPIGHHITFAAVTYFERHTPSGQPAESRKNVNHFRVE